MLATAPARLHCKHRSTPLSCPSLSFSSPGRTFTRACSFAFASFLPHGPAHCPPFSPHLRLHSHHPPCRRQQLPRRRPLYPLAQTGHHSGGDARETAIETPTPHLNPRAKPNQQQSRSHKEAHAAGGGEGGDVEAPPLPPLRHTHQSLQPARAPTAHHRHQQEEATEAEEGPAEVAPSASPSARPLEAASLAGSSRMETTLPLPLPLCKRMRPSSSPASPSYHESHEHPARNNPRPQSPRPPISPQERTKTSTTVTTSVPFAQKKSRDTREASGLVGLAGPSSILAASRSGPQTRARPLPASRPRTASFHPRDSGAALDATSPRTFYPRTSTAGVRKSWIRSRFPDFHPSLAVRPVLARESCQRNAPTRAP